MKIVTLLAADYKYKVPLYEEVESIPEKGIVGDLAITKFHNKVILYTSDGWKQLAKAERLSDDVWVAIDGFCPTCKREF